MEYNVGKITAEAEGLLYEALQVFSTTRKETKLPEESSREMLRKRITILLNDRIKTKGIIEPDALSNILQDSAATYFRAHVEEAAIKSHLQSSLNPQRLQDIIGKNTIQ